MEKSLIVAVADNWAIGRKNALIWNLPGDMAYFRKNTTGCPVIMGYMTFLSLRGPLPKRHNIVISLFPWPDAPERITLASSLENAYEIAEKDCDESEGAPTKCFVMGGAYTYKEAMAYSDTLYITHVHDVVEDADAFFPEIDPEIWEVSSRSEMQTDPVSGIQYEFVVYKRKKANQ